MRATRLDACGRPIAGACSQVVTRGFISVQMSAEVEEGEETTQRLADGSLCIAAGTLVIAARGRIPIEDLTVADLVLTRGGWQSVAAVHNTGEQQTITIRTEAGASVRATLDHKIWTVDDGWKVANQVQPGDRLLVIDDATALPGDPQDAEFMGQSVITVVTAIEAGELEQVYDITVVGPHHEFFAGGLLVHNCLAEKGDDELKWYTLEMEFCQVDPDLVSILNPTWRKVLDAQGNTIGWAEKGKLRTDTGFALELWTDTSGGDSTCDDPNAQGSFGYLLLPWNVGGAPGDLSIENSNLTFTFNGRTKVGNRWGVGPYDVQLNAGGDAGPLLAPMESDEHRLIMRTSVAPPEAACGCSALTVPPSPTLTSIVEDTEVVSGLGVELLAASSPTGTALDVDWGDGNHTLANAVWPALHTYTTGGTYLVTVKDTLTGQIKSKPVTVPFP